MKTELVVSTPRLGQVAVAELVLWSHFKEDTTGGGEDSGGFFGVTCQEEACRPRIFFQPHTFMGQNMTMGLMATCYNLFES
jgi:hypothetical protein